MSGRSDKSQYSRVAAGVVLLVIVAFGVFLFVRKPDREDRAVPPVPEAKSIDATKLGTQPAKEKTPAVGEAIGAGFDWAPVIKAARSVVSKGPDATRAFVLQLFSKLDGLTPDARLAAVMSFFDSGKDVRFGDRFTVGAGGYLSDWPTLRVALLDYLSQRDGTAARELAGLLLQSRPDEAGEWTLALRELVRGQRFEDLPPVVIDRIHEFLNDDSWAKNPSRSWLEGFDLVVATKSPSFLPDLSSAAELNEGSRAAQFAAFLASDRMMLTSPVDVMKELNGNSALFASQPNVRAGLFARADVRDSEQLGLLETYFERPDVTQAERESFAGLFPLYDLAVSKNLLTNVPSRSMADMIAHDRATEQAIARWLSRPELEPWHAASGEIKARLDQQLADAGR